MYSTKSLCKCSFSSKRSLTFDVTKIICALVAQTVKRLSTMQETQVQSLGWEESLEKEMAIHSSTIAWKIRWTEESGRLQSMGLPRVGHNWATSLSFCPYTVCWSLHERSLCKSLTARDGGCWPEDTVLIAWLWWPVGLVFMGSMAW